MFLNTALELEPCFRLKHNLVNESFRFLFEFTILISSSWKLSWFWNFFIKFTRSFIKLSLSRKLSIFSSNFSCIVEQFVHESLDYKKMNTWIISWNIFSFCLFLNYTENLFLYPFSLCLIKSLSSCTRFNSLVSSSICNWRSLTKYKKFYCFRPLINLNHLKS